MDTTTDKAAALRERIRVLEEALGDVVLALTEDVPDVDRALNTAQRAALKEQP